MSGTGGEMRTSPLVAYALFAVLALTWPAQRASAQTVLKDDQVFFQVTVPSGWTASRPTDPDEAKDLRYKVLSLDKTQALYVYVFQSDDGIDLDKLADIDSKLGWDLGKRTREESPDSSTKRRTYDRGTKGLYATALFHTEASFGYLVLALSTSSDLKFAEAVFASMAVKIPLTERLWQSRWSVLGIVGSVALWPLGRAGSSIRRGMEAKKALQAIQRQASQEGKVLNEKFHAAARKATASILWPVVGLAAAFVAAFAFLPIKLAFASLLLLIAPALGYNGILLGPSTDLEDYVPD
jgi:hypothetical protein